MLQRVTSAAVTVADAESGSGPGTVTGAIGSGLVALVGVTHHDTPVVARAMADKVFHLRILRDEQSVSSTGAAVLVVSQFTLYADARKGRRPSWNAAAPGPVAEPVYDAFCTRLSELGVDVSRGVFGADMSVQLTNDGPVTLIIES